MAGLARAYTGGPLPPRRIPNPPFVSHEVARLKRIQFSAKTEALSALQREQVFGLVCIGGFLDLDLGFELPIRVAVHRTKTRTGITVVMSIGVKSPRTKCFTAYGSDVEMYERVCESINHLATLATPAAYAA